MAETPASAVTILEAMDDPHLFGRWFSGASWEAWRAFLAALFALPMNARLLAIYQQCTRRTAAPTSPALEAYEVVGRRGGKDRIAALVVVFLACFRRYILAPGERGVVMCLAADRRQARVLFRYIEALIDSVPMLAGLVERRTKDALYLRTGLVIEIHTANFRAVRGYTVVAAVCTEVAFWRDESSANPDTEVLHALRPAMATVPGALLLCLSSPYARRGALWEAYRQYYGQDDEAVLVWQADTRTMNPTVDERVIHVAYEADDAVAAAEYGAEFRRDIESFVSREAVEACVIPERRELPPALSPHYVGFVDPSGGSQDSMTLAIAHLEDRDGQPVAVLDLVRERRPPFSPEGVVGDFTAVLRAYGCATVEGDRYGGEWPREQFGKHGVRYELAAHPKSDLYRELLPVLNSRRVELLDEPRLIAQLCGLERRTARSGKDTIDHAPNGRDDVVNSAAGAVVAALAWAGPAGVPVGIGEGRSYWRRP